MKNCEINGELIRRDEKSDEFNKYSYELLVRRGNEVANFRLPLYSVRVSMTDAYGNRTVKGLADAFADENRAISFYELAVKNLATPLNLPFILEDFAIS